MKYIKTQRINLKNHPILNEAWIQQQIANDPSLLGFGDLVLRDKERTQLNAGRLDLLLQDPETDRRYEVEVQLGKTDESHIIRTIEYWDIERRRYPQYDHCAVIIAEDITSRFLNVISLFNGHIPLVAIQLAAYEVEGGVTLHFTKVVDELPLGLVDEDEEVQSPTDRNYWEQRGSKKTLAMADELCSIVKTFDSKLELKYNKFYIGLTKDGRPNNYIVFKPQKNGLRVEFRVEQSKEIDDIIESAGIELINYNKRREAYLITLKESDITINREIIIGLFKQSYEANNNE